MIDLNPAAKREIQHILRKHLPAMEVRLVGSRANGCTKTHSDVDLLILNKTALSPESRALLNTAFEESQLPYKVDVIENCDLTPDFRASLIKNSHRIQPA